MLREKTIIDHIRHGRKAFLQILEQRVLKPYKFNDKGV